MSAAQPPQNPKPSGRQTILGLAAVAAIFLAALIGVSVWVVKKFVVSAPEVIMIPQMASTPGAAATAAPSAARPNRPAANNPPPRNMPTFSGNVVDAATHQPITDFAILIGYSFQGSNRPPRYDGMAAQSVKSDTGSYKVSSHISGPTMWYVRVEARGYLPSVSKLMKGSDTADFELKPGKDITGHIFAPDGSPAAGVSLMVVRGGDNAFITNGKLQASPVAKNPYPVSGADGAYDLPPEIDSYALVATSDVGFAQADQDALATSSDLHLSAWGRIEGTLRIGSNPGSNATMSANTLDNSGAHSAAKPQINWQQTATTDADGHFVMYRVRPGKAQLGRQFTTKFGNGVIISSVTQTTTVMVTSGQTVTANVGGGGRRVTGRLIYPSGVNGTNSYINCSVSGDVPAPIIDPMPDGVKKASSDARNAWLGIFSITPAGRAYFKLHPAAIADASRIYALEYLDKNRETFEIQDMQAGDYDGWLFLQSLNNGRAAQPTTFGFSVPPITPELADQPLAIPDIQVQ